MPCLKDILDGEIFRSYLLFVDSIHTLLKEEISEAELKQCTYNLLKFVGESEILYGLEFVTYNLHSLLHYCESVRKTGPLWANSAFPFESAIYYFTRQINAPNGCCTQIAEKWLKKCIFESYVVNNTCNSESSLRYCKTLLQRRPLLKNCTKLDNVTLIGEEDKNESVQNLLRSFTKNKYLNVTCYNRCIYESSYIHSVPYKRVSKTDDSIVKLTDKKIFQIHYFVKGKEICYICDCEWIICDNDFNGNDETPILRHIFKVVRKMSQLVVYNISTVYRKAIVIDNGENTYISFLPNTFENH